jgi:flagellar motor switch protein FliM
MGRLGPGELERLERLQRSFAARATSALGSFIDGPLRIELAGIAAASRGDSLETPPEGTRPYLARRRGAGWSFLIEVTPCLLRAVVARLLGQPAGEPAAARLTPLEEALARSIIERLLEELGELWGEAGPRGFVLEAALAHALPLAGEPSRGAQVLVRFTVASRDITGELRLVLSEGPLIAELSAPRAKPAREREAPSARRILSRLGGEEVVLRAAFESAPLPLRLLLGLRPGDVIDTGLGAEHAISLETGGEHVAAAKLRRRQGKLVLELALAEESR